MKIDNFNDFDFNFEKIMDYCNGIKEWGEQIIYLKWVLIELEHQGEFVHDLLKSGYKQYCLDIENIDVEGDGIIAPEYSDYKDFPEVIQREIDYREKQFNLEKINKEESETELERVDDNIRLGDKIHWTGTETQLTRLIDLLIGKGLIEIGPLGIYQFICKYFKNRLCKPLKTTQLSVSAQKKSKKEEIVENIVTKVVDTKITKNQ